MNARPALAVLAAAWVMASIASTAHGERAMARGGNGPPRWPDAQFAPGRGRDFVAPAAVGRPQFSQNIRAAPPMSVPTSVRPKPSPPLNISPSVRQNRFVPPVDLSPIRQDRSAPPASVSPPIRQTPAAPSSRPTFASAPARPLPNSDRQFPARGFAGDTVVWSKSAVWTGPVSCAPKHWRQKFFRDGCHHRHRFIFINSCWFWWDPWYDCWYYWPGPPPYVYEEQWQFAPDNGLYSSPADYERGRQWGQDLRREVVSWEVFVEFLRANIVGASPVVFSEFRRGFIVGYGENGLAAFDKAMREAAPPPPAEPASEDETD